MDNVGTNPKTVAAYITGCDLRVDGGTVAARLHPAQEGARS